MSIRQQRVDPPKQQALLLRGSGLSVNGWLYIPAFAVPLWGFCGSVINGLQLLYTHHQLAFKLTIIFPMCHATDCYVHMLDCFHRILDRSYGLDTVGSRKLMRHISQASILGSDPRKRL